MNGDTRISREFSAYIPNNGSIKRCESEPQGIASLIKKPKLVEWTDAW